MQTLVATTLEGLEDALAKELVSLGATHTKIAKRAVLFEAPADTVYEIVVFSRLTLKFLFTLMEFEIQKGDQLYGKALFIWFSVDPVTGIRWNRIFNLVE